MKTLYFTVLIASMLVAFVSLLIGKVIVFAIISVIMMLITAVVIYLVDRESSRSSLFN